MGERPNQVGASRYAIFQQVHGSLRRLRTDHLDIYWIHRWDPETPIAETISALDDLVRMGKVRYIGASNFFAWQLAKSLWASDVHGWERFECLQPRYGLSHRDIEVEVLPLCADQQVGVVPYNALAGGLFSGKYVEGKAPPSDTRLAISGDYRERFLTRRNFRILEGLRAKAAELGVTPAQLSIAWVESHPLVTSAIVGVSSVAQLEENVGAIDIRLTPEEREELAALGEGGSHG
jgi:aryl-alcohol dehydrogenase-like predicted oxidoreductase